MGTDIVTNRKARHNYTILESFEAGLSLRGTEVKSIRQGLVNMSSAFARLDKGQLVLHGLDIQPYERASHEQHEAKRPRRLLVHRAELVKLSEAVEQQGCSLPALRLYWKKHHVKVQIGLAQGKKNHDKRHDLKRQMAEREASRTAAAFNRRG